MHTAQVANWGEAPKYLEVESPPAPPTDSNLVQIKLTAAGLPQVARSRASGKHYTSTALPHTVGVDGVGTTSSGQPVYFSTLATGGSFSEYINVPKHAMWPLPEALDPVQVAALLNPAMSSWMALRTRTTNLPEKFTVLIMGVTSASGSIAISLARSLGAGKVIGVARNLAKLVELDLDETIQLMDPVEKTDFSNLGDVDVVLDYLYAKPTEHLFGSLKSKVLVQYVHIGGLAGLELNLPGAILRAKDIRITGAGPGSWGFPQLGKEIPGLLEGLKGVMKKQSVKIVKLEDVEKAWGEKSEERMVFVP
jgi:NADPH:quinone reductase-like Zn-dependent oxidoreductase